MFSTLERRDSRARIGWWLLVVALGATAAYLVHSFIGLFVVGVFGYYATRPIYRRVDRVVDSDELVAAATVLLVLVPILALTLYAGVQLFHAAQQQLGSSSGLVPAVLGSYDLAALPAGKQAQLLSTLQQPSQLLATPQQSLQRVVQLGARAMSAVVGALLLLSLSVTLSYFLLAHDDSIGDALTQLMGGRDTTAYAYAAAVDEDLETVFFGNLVFVGVMSVVSLAVYGATNLLAPQGIGVPMILVLSVLTGFASLIPIVVGKVVYVPVVGFLALQSLQQGGDHLPFVGAALVAYFVLLDIVPQSILQPYITSRNVDATVLLFGYLLGPILFGWYGFFLLPIVFVVMLEAIRIPLLELVHGERLTPTVSLGDGAGANLRSLLGPNAGEGSGSAGSSGDD